MSAPITTSDAIASGWVECRTCGHRAPTPEEHNAVGAIRCPKPEWMTPQPRGFELPRAQSSVPVFTSAPKPPRVRRGEQ